MKRRFESREARRRRRRRQRLLMLVAAAALMVVIVGLIIWIIVSAVGAANRPDDTSQTSSPTSSAVTESVPDESSTAAPPPISSVGEEWFADAVFIGDSRTEGLMLYTQLEVDALADKGMTVTTALTQDLVTLPNGEKGTVIDGLAQKDYAKVYVMLGVNELGWTYSSIFQREYGELIDAIKEAEPEATIYVQSILPVTKAHSESHDYQTKEKVDEYNRLIQEMCIEKGVQYLKVEDAVMTEDGYMIPECAAQDGVHMNTAGCLKWLDYLKQHY